MMKAYRLVFESVCCAFLALSVLSCGQKEGTEQDAYEQEKVDISSASVSLNGGCARVLCSWKGVPSEIALIHVDFVSGTAVDIPVPSSSGKRYITKMPEGTYKASISYITTGGNVVDGTSVDVRVYGSGYEASLPASALKANVDFKGSFAIVSFQGEASNLPEGYLREEFCFKAAGGDETVVTAISDTTLMDVAGKLVIRSVYCPDPELGDLFYSSGTTYENTSWVEPASYNETVDGYRGIWFDLGQAASSYGSKYSGGLGTYTMKHIPMSIYAPEVDRTYFVYGGTPDQNRKYLLCMVGCYDHRTHKLQKPRIVMDKGILGVADPHDDPTIQIDKDGYIWIFVSGRGNKRYGKRYRSVNPYDITAFEFKNESIMAYPQVMYNKEKGFFLFFTRYDGTRQLFYQTSPDGLTWSDYKQLASIKEGTEKNSGHYQISNICGTKLCTAFNRHINGNVDTRTNVYFIQSTDWGQTWTTVDGQPVEVPVVTWDSNCLVRDYQHTTETHNCYIKDVNFDSAGNPIILYLTSKNHYTGPDGGTRQWHVLYWTGTEWFESLLTTSRHCYDSGSLWVEGDDWVVIAPTDPGPTYWGSGGEVVKWRSTDKGKSWNREKTLTANSELNHTYMRRPWYCADGFYSFWADGNPDKFTPSHLYFCDKSGTVYRMPYSFTSSWITPETYPAAQ